MSKNVFHASIEGAQHGAKTLDEFVNFAKTAGASGAEPSNYHIEDGNGGFKKAKEISDIFDIPEPLVLQGSTVWRQLGSISTQV